MATVDVTLIKKHRHAGRDYQPEEKISVSEQEAQFLLRNKVIDKVPGVNTKADSKN